METAPTWDSYKEALLGVIDVLKPKRVLEFGIGKSTDLFLSLDCIETLDSVEHNPEWVAKYHSKVSDRFNLIFEPDPFLYPLVEGRFQEYDLVFVDGIQRPECLDNYRDKCKVAIIHDAERPQYQEAIEKYYFRAWFDGGHTVVLCNDEDTRYKKLTYFLDESKTNMHLYEKGYK